MKFVLTGGNGFLGWHTRVRLHARGDQSKLIGVGDNFDLSAATLAVEESEAVIHLAGVNRGTDAEIKAGNIQFALQLAQALESASSPPTIVVFANSVQAGNQSTYGDSKSGAADVVRAACARADITFVDIKLPNLFGEHGKPFYNSVVATFCHLLVEGEMPKIHEDRELAFLHAQHAASWLIGETQYPARSTSTFYLSVRGLLDKLTAMASTYARGEIPDLTPMGNRDLFNTYRSHIAGPSMPINMNRKEDDRGSFFEIVRNHGGPGQTSFSTTYPGITRGQHYHLNKVERFTVLSGSARISMRRLFHDEVVSFDVDGEEPVSIDMPTLWSHNIENIGATPLYTMFWTDDIFNPDAPDTFAEDV